MLRKALLSWIIIIVFGLSGCSQGARTSHFLDSESFLNIYKLSVKGNPTIIKVDVPTDWHIQLGTYPIGLYWGLANEFSKDVGLDLTNLKGKTIEAHVYELKDGLPGSGQSASFSYPSNAILIVQNEQVVGAWLSFNTLSIGPSVKKRSLNEVTGLSFDEWVKRERYFTEEDLLGYFNGQRIIEKGLMENLENHGEEGSHTHQLRYILVQKQ